MTRIQRAARRRAFTAITPRRPAALRAGEVIAAFVGVLERIEGVAQRGQAGRSSQASEQRR